MKLQDASTLTKEQARNTAAVVVRVADWGGEPTLRLDAIWGIPVGTPVFILAEGMTLEFLDQEEAKQFLTKALRMCGQEHVIPLLK